MLRFRDPLLELVAATGSPWERAWAAIELGRADEADRAIARLPETESRRSDLAAELLALRGDFLAALHATDRALSQSRILTMLGQHDRALLAIEGMADGEADLQRADVHLSATEIGPAEVALPRTPFAVVGTVQSQAAALLLNARRLTLRAELLIAKGGDPHTALDHLRGARESARLAGAVTAEANALARLGDAHARAGHRWRALRSVTAAVDLVATDRVHPGSSPGVQLRAYRIYSAYGHERLAKTVISSAHTRVVQIASGIDEREYRESYFLENRDCQGVVAAWKGDPAWGSEIATSGRHA